MFKVHAMRFRGLAFGLEKKKGFQSVCYVKKKRSICYMYIKYYVNLELR